jgi:hypothetical protein
MGRFLNSRRRIFVLILIFIQEAAAQPDNGYLFLGENIIAFRLAAAFNRFIAI